MLSLENVFCFSFLDIQHAATPSRRVRDRRIATPKSRGRLEEWTATWLRHKVRLCRTPAWMRCMRFCRHRWPCSRVVAFNYCFLSSPLPLLRGWWRVYVALVVRYRRPFYLMLLSSPLALLHGWWRVCVALVVTVGPDPRVVAACILCYSCF